MHSLTESHVSKNANATHQSQGGRLRNSVDPWEILWILAGIIGGQNQADAFEHEASLVESAGKLLQKINKHDKRL